ncbi:MAG: hypothetical protein HY343_12690 [Lentisphaerae bacterium]|nr:hypothetical protein [Lentisphaerota bacterium]
MIKPVTFNGWFVLYSWILSCVWTKDLLLFLAYRGGWAWPGWLVNAVVLALGLFGAGLFRKTLRLDFGGCRFMGLVLVAFIPILMVGLWRIPFPDRNVDTTCYHLFLQDFRFGEHAMHCGQSGDMSHLFPFPLADRVFSPFRHWLGYRAGTLPNILLLFVIGSQIGDLLRRFIADRHGRLSLPGAALFVLLVVSSEFMLLNIGTYMVDLLPLPFLLEMTRLAIFGERGRYVAWTMAFLAGMAVTLKFGSLIFAIPLVAAWGWLWRPRAGWREILPTLLLLLLLPAVYMAYNYEWTRNPVIPIFNRFFQSPFYPAEHYKDLRWGPQGGWQALLWPVYILFDARRLSDLGCAYMGRLSLIAPVCLSFLVWRFKRPAPDGTPTLSILVGVSLVSIVAWAFSTGYIRYALFAELLVGLTVLCLALVLREGRGWARFAGYALIGLLCMQVAASYRLLTQGINWSWYEKTSAIDYDPRANWTLVGRDRQTAVAPDLVARVDAWILFGYGAGYARLIKPEVPILNVRSARLTPFLHRQYRDRLNNLSGRHLFTLYASPSGGLEEIIEQLNRYGFKLVNANLCQPTFLRKGEMFYLLEIAPQQESRLDVSTLTDSGRQAEHEFKGPPGTVFRLECFVGCHPRMWNWTVNDFQAVIRVVEDGQSRELWRGTLKKYDGLVRVEKEVAFTSAGSKRIVVGYEGLPGQPPPDHWLLQALQRSTLSP